MQDIKSKKLKNGLSLIVAPDRRFPSAIFRFYLLAGSRMETKKNNGLVHLLEHLFAEKIKSRLADENGKTWISSHIFKNFDAYTTKEYSEFSFDIHESDMPKALQVLATVIKKPDFTQEDLDREKGIIASEIDEAKDDFFKKIYQKVQKSYFGKSSLAMPVMGNVSNIIKFNLKEINRYYQQIFNPKNICLTLGGSIDSSTQKSAERLFGELKPNAFSSIQKWEKFTGRVGKITANNKEAKQTYYNLIYTIPAKSYQDRLFWQFLGEILHDYFNENIREKEAAIYSADLTLEEYREFLSLYISFSVHPKKLAKIIRLVDVLLKNFAKNFREEELLCAKNAYIKELDLDWTYPSSVTSMLGRQLALGVPSIIDGKKETKLIKSIGRKKIINELEGLVQSKGFRHITKSLYAKAN